MTNTGNRSLRIAFLFSCDWSHELNDYMRGTVPAHRLFGYVGLQALGHAVRLFRLAPLSRTVNQHPVLWRIVQALWATVQQRAINVFICATEAPALPLLVLKRVGLLRKPIVVLNVALMEPRNCSGWRQWLWARLLPCADAIVSYASAQLSGLQQQFSLDGTNLHFIPFGVDTKYFSAEPRQAAEPFLLSVGTNAGKDFCTLLDSLPEYAKLLVVTDSWNQRVIEEHPKSRQVEIRTAVPILELRRLYRDAIAQVIPLHETKFSSGQTVMLENMAMGKTTIVSETSATRDYICPGVRTFRPGDSAQLQAQLSAVLAEDDSMVTDKNLSRYVHENFSGDLFAQRLSNLLCKLDNDDYLTARRMKYIDSIGRNSAKTRSVQ